MADSPFDAADLPPLRDVIARHGLAARKSLGQHFLLDLNLTRKIVRLAPDLTDATVVEVGPGPGGLTRALLESPARRIVAVERDSRCIAALEELRSRAGDRLEIVSGDALETDVAALGPPPRQIVANLPYNISTVLLLRWLDAASAIAGMTLMFQKEVAARIVATGGRDYGRLAVQAQWRCTVETLFDIPPQAFVPPPRIWSTVLRLTPRPAPLHPADPADLSRVLAAAFGQRRKMLRASLRSLGADVAELCARAGIDPTSRAEDISIEGFCALARAWRQSVSRPTEAP